MQRGEQMEVFAKEKLKEDEDRNGRYRLETTVLRFVTWLDNLLVSLIGERSSLVLPLNLHRTA